MRLKNFYETFRDDLKDQEFVIGYLEDALEEGGISFFIKALEDVVQVNKNILDCQLFDQFINDSDPKMSVVSAILNQLGLQINLKVKC